MAQVASEERREDMSKPEETRRRVQLEFSESAFRRLQELRDETDAQTNAEVVRNALRAYAWLVSVQKKDQRILVQSVDGKIQEVVKFLF